MKQLIRGVQQRWLLRLSNLRVKLIIAADLRGEAIKYLRNPTPHHSISLLRAFGAHIGQGTTIKRSLLLDNVSRDENSSGDFSHITFGGNCYIGDGVYLDLANRVTLEDNAVLSGHVSIITHADCNRSPFLSEKIPRTCTPVHIGDGAWIGFGSTLLNGVHIGTGAVVGANSLVTDDVEEYCLYAGTPARKIRRL